MIGCDQRKKVIGNLDVHELLLDIEAASIGQGVNIMGKGVLWKRGRSGPKKNIWSYINPPTL